MKKILTVYTGGFKTSDMVKDRGWGDLKNEALASWPEWFFYAEVTAIAECAWYRNKTVYITLDSRAASMALQICSCYQGDVTCPEDSVLQKQRVLVVGYTLLFGVQITELAFAWLSLSDLTLDNEKHQSTSWNVYAKKDISDPWTAAHKRCL